MNKGQVLVIGSNATRLEVQGGGTIATGQYLNETVVPAMAILDAGYQIVLATPTGEKPHIDAASDTADHFDGDVAAYEKAKDFYQNHPAMNQVRTLASLLEEGLDNYVGVFVPGGHAPIVDLMQNRETGEILRAFHEASKPTALLCHGPIAVAAALPHAAEYRSALMAGDSRKAAELAKDWPYAGYKMTVFSNSEETIVEDQYFHAKLYFRMADALQTLGGIVITNPENFEANVIEDRELITGQNPRSDRLLAQTFVAALDRKGVQHAPAR